MADPINDTIMPSAAERAFGLPELLEAILMSHDYMQLFAVERVSRGFQSVLQNSKKLCCKMFLEPALGGDPDTERSAGLQLFRYYTSGVNPLLHMGTWRLRTIEVRILGFFLGRDNVWRLKVMRDAGTGGRGRPFAIKSERSCRSMLLMLDGSRVISRPIDNSRLIHRQGATTVGELADELYRTYAESRDDQIAGENDELQSRISEDPSSNTVIQ